MRSLLCLLIAATLAVAADVDVTGKWTGTFKMTGPNGEANDSAAVLTLKQSTMLGNVPRDWDVKPLKSLLQFNTPGDWGDDGGPHMIRLPDDRIVAAVGRRRPISTSWEEPRCCQESCAGFKGTRKTASCVRSRTVCCSCRRKSSASLS